MKPTRLTLTIFGLMAPLALMLSTPAGAQNYFSGKTVNVYVPSGGGSGLDIMARAVVDVWKKHIPGSPSVIIRNQNKGRGGKTLNFVYEKGNRDGTDLSFGSWIPLKVLSGAPGVRHVPEKMGLVGAFSTWSMVFVRTDVGSGIKKPADIVKANKPFIMGGRYSEATPDILGNMTLDILGIKYKFISGYRGSSKIIPAMLSNEVQGGTGSFSTYRRLKSYIDEGKLIALWHDARFKEDGTPVKMNPVPNVPTFTDVYREIHGKDPSGPTYEAYKWYVNTVISSALSMLTPPGVPEEALKDLRTAFNRLVDDPEFQAVQKKRGVSLRPLSVERGQKIFTNFRKIPPEVKKELERMATKGTG